MLKIVRENIKIEESISDKFIAQDSNLSRVPREHEEFEKKYKEEQEKQKLKGDKKPFYRNEDFIIWRNPEYLTNFGKDVRGVIIENGDLFLEFRPNNIHNDILSVLKAEQLVLQETNKNWTTVLPTKSKFLTVQRVGDSNTIAIGESNRLIYVYANYKKYINEYKVFLEKAQKKCPNIQFSDKLIEAAMPQKINNHIIRK